MANHWYRLDNGEPLYQVPRKNGGGFRDTTLADARKLNLVPSVTTILSLVDKPALTRWRINEVIEAVIKIGPPECGELIEQWKCSIIKESERKGKDAAEKGNEIHNALEKFYTVGLMRKTRPDILEFITPVVEVLSETFGHMCEWQAEHSFSHPSGFGGKCDLHLKPCKNYPNGIIVDFKTKSAEDFSKVKAYPEHCQQLVAYREGFGMPKAECYNLFVSTNKPGDVLLHKWTEKDCVKGWKCFSSLLEYWKAINQFA